MKMAKLRVLELFSGIGGMHMALKEAGVCCDVVAAMDINTAANTVYRHNFPRSHVLERNIEGVSADQLDKLDFNVLLMSPPCQPYTRLGKQRGMDDHRATSLCKLIKNLQAMRSPPEFILLENVRGFEQSKTRAFVVGALTVMQFHYCEFLLCPTQLGVPNSRLRYYLLARKQKFCFEQTPADQLLRDIPVCRCKPDFTRSVCDQCGYCPIPGLSEKLRTICHQYSPQSEIPTLSEFLQLPNDSGDATDPPGLSGPSKEEVRVDELLMSESMLSRYGWLVDLVYPHSRRSCCVTRGYGRRVEGTGSLLVPTASEATVSVTYQQTRQWSCGDPRIGATLAPLLIRRLSPRETARLMCVPEWFVWPPSTSAQLTYRHLGNSVNVRVVAALVTLLLH